MPIADMPQGNKSHAVPQNIMDVEFKLIGDLTMRQFIYLFIFGGAAYVTSVVAVGIFKWPAVLLLALLGIGLAFVPIQERGLDEWIVNFVKSVYSPTQRVWRHDATPPSLFLHDNLAVVKQELITLAPTSSRRKLEEYLEYHLTEENVDPLDIQEREAIMKVKNAYVGYEFTEPEVGVSVMEPIAGFPPSAGMGQQPDYQQEPEPAQENAPQVTQASQSEQAPNEQASAEQLKEVTTVHPQPAEVTAQPTETGEQSQQPAQPVYAPLVRSAPAPQIHKPKQYAPSYKPHTQTSPILSTMTPDMHSGRRFTNLVPKSGELVLPIRGERVIKTTEQTEVEEDIKEKAERLQQLLSQIKGSTWQPKAPTATSAPEAPQVPAEAATIADKLQKENVRLTDQIEELENQKKAATSESEAQEKDNMIKRLQLEKERTQSDFESLQNQILELQNRLKEQQPAGDNNPTTVAPTFVQNQPAGKPNIVFGNVRLKDGSTKAGVLLIMKNKKGEAVRALKTNALGEFRLSTPLANGVYTLEVSHDTSGTTFDIISVEVKGEPIPPINIVGR